MGTLQLDERRSAWNETPKASRGKWQWGRVSPPPADYGVWKTGVSFPQQGPRGRALSKNEFGYSIAVRFILVVMLLCWRFRGGYFTMRRLATANRSRVSIRVAKLVGQGRWRGLPCDSFCLIGCSLIIMRNLVTVSHIVCAHVIFRTLDPSPSGWGVSVTHRNTPQPHMCGGGTNTSVSQSLCLLCNHRRGQNEKSGLAKNGRVKWMTTFLVLFIWF